MQGWSSCMCKRCLGKWSGLVACIWKVVTNSNDIVVISACVENAGCDWGHYQTGTVNSSNACWDSIVKNQLRHQWQVCLCDLCDWCFAPYPPAVFMNKSTSQTTRHAPYRYKTIKQRSYKCAVKVSDVIVDTWAFNTRYSNICCTCISKVMNELWGIFIAIIGL